MPPRHKYWTIILEGKPTAFRAHSSEELLPTLKQLQSKHPDAVMKWFARGRLWHSPEEEQLAERVPRERRSPAWRPGGEHRDPREQFKVPRDEKRRRFAAKLRRERQVESQNPDTGGPPSRRPQGSGDGSPFRRPDRAGRPEHRGSWRPEERKTPWSKTGTWDKDKRGPDEGRRGRSGDRRPGGQRPGASRWGSDRPGGRPNVGPGGGRGPGGGGRGPGGSGRGPGDRGRGPGDSGRGPGGSGRGPDNRPPRGGGPRQDRGGRGGGNRGGNRGGGGGRGPR